MKRFATVGAAVVWAWLLLAGPALSSTPAGPPYPPAVVGGRVYDNAGIFSPETVSTAESIIAGIEQRTKAQVAVYTQVKPESDTLDLANADARALMDQWGVGRKGFDDGLVIMFDMQGNLRHGEVSLYAGAGYRAAFLSDADRQTIFDDDMKPLLADGDLDGGLLAGLRDIDANATPDHAAALERDRQINALVFVAALLVGWVLILAAVLRWLRHGRDPVYIDDNSILMPAPPEGLTPAMATILMADRTTKRTVTAGLLDLAAQGAIAFRQERRQIGGNPLHTGITYLGRGKGPLQDPEHELLDAIVERSKTFDNYVSSTRLYRLSDNFDTFGEQLETAAVARGWLTEQPGRVVLRWGTIGGTEIALAIVAGILWLVFLASALLVLTMSLVVAGAATLGLAYFMPARTRQGAMLYAMLSAYKRTLGLTMTASKSMGEVVQRHALPWITTPDEAMVWGVAFGLDREVELVLSRTLAGTEGEPTDGEPSETSTYWYPSWWTMASHSSGGHAGETVAFSARSAGLFSSSPIPDPGSIMAALGSIASPSSPASSGGSSSGSSFSSGSFGGGGGGGGGGAGGGF
ncbi:MAG: TPM domain-containing protein [Candidatus Limnocylindrales bacterium]